MSNRTDYLAFLAAQGFEPNRAICFEEGVGTPVEFYTSTSVTQINTPTWGTPDGYTAGNCDDVGDQYSLATSSDFLGTDEQTVLIMRKRQDTTARECQLFGSTSGVNHCDAEVPWNDGNVKWAVGGATILQVAGTRTTNIEAWGFRFGASGMRIWKNGTEVASNATVVTRGSSANAFKLNGGGLFDSGDPQYFFFLALIPAETDDATMATFTASNVLTGIPAASDVNFRRTFSQIGGRSGARQRIIL